MNNLAPFYTYCHVRADTGHVFYVGKGKGRRAWAKRNRNNHWCNIVNKCGYRVYVLDRFVDEAEAFKHERELIEVARLAGIPLCNLTDGGEGVSGMVFTKEHRAKISAANKGQSRPVSDETRAKISAALKGHAVTSITKEKLSIARRARPPLSDETKKKISEGNKGKTISSAQRLLIGAVQRARKRTPMTAAQKLKISCKLKGRKFSVEHCSNISAAKRKICV